MAASAWPLQLGHDGIDGQLPTPLYHQIYLLLRDAIRRGDLEAGSVLPGEIDLAETFKVSRITVKRALNELATDALVTRHRGRGTIVTPTPQLSVVRGSYDSLLESLKAMGHETQVKLLETTDVLPGDAIAELLEIPPGRKVQRAVRLRTLQGGPFSYLVSYVPSHIAKSYSRADLASLPLLTLLERAGVSIDGADQWITAVGAEPKIATALGVVAGAPLLKIERLMRDAAGTPVELVHGHYRPDRFTYFVQQRGLSRKKPAAASQESPGADVAKQRRPRRAGTRGPSKPTTRSTPIR